MRSGRVVDRAMENIWSKHKPEAQLQLHGWSARRRVVIVRQRIRGTIMLGGGGGEAYV